MIKKKLSLIFLFILFTVPASLSAVDREDYDNGLEKYKNDQNEEALILLEKFVREYPDSIKADDAQWYMGKIQRRLDRDDEAIILFRKVLDDQSSNRYEEAAYDLAKIYYYGKNYLDVLTILAFLDEVEELNNYHKKGLELRSRAYYRLAYGHKQEYRDEKARNLFNSSLNGYKILENLYDDSEDLSRVHLAIARIFNNLADISYERESYEANVDNALNYARISMQNISDDDEKDVEQLIKDLEGRESVGLSGMIKASAGLDNLSAGTFGAVAKTSGTVRFPTAGRSSLELELSYGHNSFDFVTSNFDPLKTGDERMVQWAELIGLDFDWRSGSRRHVYNKFSLFSHYQFAEDRDDNYFNTGFSDYGSIRFNKSWRFLWDSEIEWTTFPNYLSSGRKLDAFNISIEPELRFYALDWLEISLLYGFGLKPYVESKYDTNDPAVPSTRDKMNMVNSGALVLDFSPYQVYDAEIAYEFTYAKSLNYDYWVNGQPADLYVEDYYDYISHKISMDNRLRVGKRFELNLDGSLKFTDFINYPARDETRTFTGEKRRDITFGVDGEVGYVFLITPGGTEFEALLSGWWNFKVSNMTYNTTFDTNYSFAGLMLGLTIKTP